jgi:hypothetical protein
MSAGKSITMPAITIQVESGLGLPYAPGAEQSLPFILLAAWNACWGALGAELPSLCPLFDEAPASEIAQIMADAENASGQPAPDLFRWYAVDLGPIDPQLAVTAIRALPFVAQAEVQLDPQELVNPTQNPQFVNQRYLLAAPEGIDAQYAWSVLGGDGAGAFIIDVEFGWWSQHEDLVNVPVQVLGGLPDPDSAHGTCVLGILAAEDNNKGIVGIAPAAQLAFSPLKRAPGPGVVNPDKNVPNAIFRAIQLQWHYPDYPMILLIEVGHFAGVGSDKTLPAEDEASVPDLIQLAIQFGMTVVEPAGNGGFDLDAYTKNGVRTLARANFDSGAIMVAAAGAGMSQRKLPFSCYGSRVDCFAWGEGVRTCSLDVIPTLYRDFSGTSSASAIVAGAAAVVQAVAVARTGSPFTPRRVRELLSNPALNTTALSPEPIGVMPNLKAIIDSIPVGP